MAAPVKRPAFQWYPGDHRRDTALVACSFEARALWRDMMDLMHDGEPYGHLTAGGVPLTDAALARIVGVTVARVKKWRDELKAHGVYSETDTGVIYSRRMVKDEHIRNVRASAGGLGGNPAITAPTPTVLDKQTTAGTPGLLKQTGKQSPTPAVAVAVALPVVDVGDGARGTSEPDRPSDPEAPALAVVLTRAANRGAFDVAGEQPAPLTVANGAAALVEACHEAGVPPSFAERAVADAARRFAERTRPGQRRQPQTLAYFRAELLRMWAEDEARRSAAASPSPATLPLSGPAPSLADARRPNRHEAAQAGTFARAMRRPEDPRVALERRRAERAAATNGAAPLAIPARTGT